MMNSEAVDPATVRELFDEGRRLLEQSGDYHSQSDDYKKTVQKATLMLEDATRAVSALDMFSRNEDVSEIPSENLRFLSLPYYLGLLTLKASWKANEHRLELLKAATVYFKDFLERIENLGLPTGGSSLNEGSGDGNNLEKLAAERRLKMERLRTIRALELKAGELLATDGEDSHEYWRAVLEKQCLEARDELDLVNRELPIVEHRIAHSEKEGRLGRPEEEGSAAQERRVGWKPVILCRDEAQKKVFGLGYPSLPSMTVAEFYEKRVNEGWFQCGMKKAEAEMAPSETDEEKAERKDREEEADDAGALAKARNWDEFKDDNPRGWGNRHNKG